jgi:hypothetical protein
VVDVGGGGQNVEVTADYVWAGVDHDLKTRTYTQPQRLLLVLAAKEAQGWSAAWLFTAS